MEIYKDTQIKELANILKNDGVIAVPTDTVYGLCACINSKKAKERLEKIKNRSENKIFPVMCADLEQIYSIANVDKKSEKIIKTFMPGPITILLEKKKEIPQYVNKGLKLIAIRMATSKPLEELIKMAGSPLFMTSANLSGEPECNNILEIKDKFKDVSGILEGKVCYGKASTIADCTSGEVRILREGPILLNKIQQAII